MNVAGFSGDAGNVVFVINSEGRFLLFQMYHNFANLFFKLSVNTYYEEISKFQQKVQS